MTTPRSRHEGQSSTTALPPTRRRRSAPAGSVLPPPREPLAKEDASVHEGAGDVPLVASLARDLAEAETVSPSVAIRRRRSRDNATALAGNTEAAAHRRERRHRVDEERPQPRRRRSFFAFFQLLLGLGCWAALGYVVYATDPADPMARVAFFGAMFGALFFTVSPLLRSLTLRFSRSRLYQEASGRHAARQALLLATFATLNAGMAAMRSWSALNALLLLGTFAVIEVVALARR